MVLNQIIPWLVKMEIVVSLTMLIQQWALLPPLTARLNNSGQKKCAIDTTAHLKYYLA